MATFKDCLFVFVLCQTMSKHGYRNSDLSSLMSVVSLCQGTRDGRAGWHRETICSCPFEFLVEHTMKRCPKVKEPPDASKPTLAALAMSHVALWLQLPAPPTLTGTITAMASCVLHASLLAATPPSCSRQRNPFSPISTLAPLALKAFPYWLWLKFHLLGLGFHCV